MGVKEINYFKAPEKQDALLFGASLKYHAASHSSQVPQHFPVTRLDTGPSVLIKEKRSPETEGTK